RRVGRRIPDEARRLAAEAGKPLRLVAPDGHLEARALAARHGLPLDSL
ncbi:aspartate 1-decarboxylase autocleavage activator PanM, partial [Pseudomonas aeruginosa]|nr:aspartate 1-decarboxylase autocleavage activator PanM [Pseudomonas aeruginosa]